ncbi:hypothetical protein BKA80DRAFT_59573 [Phyllosticta citrichinensis]
MAYGFLVLITFFFVALLLLDSFMHGVWLSRPHHLLLHHHHCLLLFSLVPSSSSFSSAAASSSSSSSSSPWISGRFSVPCIKSSSRDYNSQSHILSIDTFIDHSCIHRRVEWLLPRHCYNGWAERWLPRSLIQHVTLLPAPVGR